MRAVCLSLALGIRQAASSGPMPKITGEGGVFFFFFFFSFPDVSENTCFAVRLIIKRPGREQARNYYYGGLVETQRSA